MTSRKTAAKENGGVLRDIPKNGCEGDYPGVDVRQGRGGGGGGDEVWDRETMFSQLAKRSIRGLISGLPRQRYIFSWFQLWL